MEVDQEPNLPKVGWQRQAVKQVEQAFIQNEVSSIRSFHGASYIQ